MGSNKKLHIPRDHQKKHYDIETGDLLQAVMIMPGRKMVWKSTQSGEIIDKRRVELR